MTFEREMMNSLTDEIEQLRVDCNEAFIDGANTERAKIVAWLRDTQQICKEKMTQGILPLLHKHHAEHCKFSANAIESGEHLK